MKKLIAVLSFLLLIPNYHFCQWSNQNSGTGYTLYSVDFLTENDGWIAGRENIIKETTDGGQTWDLFSRYTQPPSENWYDISFVSSADIYACGNTYNWDRWQSNWIRSTNGGYSWTSQSFWGSDNSGWKDVFFIDENNGWVSGNNGAIYNTNDGGENWTLQTSNTNKSLKSIYFIDESNGWCVGHRADTAVILKTTDGGENWSTTLPTDFIDLNCVCFANSDIGWACGSKAFEQEERGTILYSENGGESWEVQHIDNTISIYYDIDFIDDNTGWVVGTKGILLKTTTGGVTGIVDESNSVIKEFALEQNYPNPFNPTTRISYIIPKFGHVKLSLYNSLGEAISVLVNENKNPGKYIVDFNAGDLSSGVYYYRIESSIYSETKKMILLR